MVLLFSTFTMNAKSNNFKERNLFLTFAKENPKQLNKRATKTDHPLVSKEQWNILFPYRFGSKDTGGGVWVLDPKKDFYTYESFMEAINRMDKIKVIFERRCGTNAYKITRIDKVTGESNTFRTDVDFDAPRNSDKEIITEEVDYGSFLNEGDLETRKRELVAFFANISHETTGGWDAAPGGKYSWGLHFREEPTNASYAYPDTNYPPTPGKSYKGRGPIQLSYNYNYGPASEFIFGDKKVLLDNPDLVIQDAALAFQTAIWFWMTPQYPKPSAHNVMVGKWVPNDLDKTKNRVPGLGMTVNIINGGVECGQGKEKPQVLSRIGYYKRYTGIYNIGTDMDGVDDLSDCGCKDMSKYGGDSADFTAEPCAQKPAITFVKPIDDQLIKQEKFSSIEVTINVDQKKSVLKTITTTIGGKTFSGKSFSWTPNSYGAVDLVANATFENGLSATNTIKVIISDGVNLDCSDIPVWRSTKIYDKPNNYVTYKNVVYRNKWYAGTGNTPGINGVWEKVKDCGTIEKTPPVVNWQAPLNGKIFETKKLSPITLKAKATDSDGEVVSFYFVHNGANIAATKSEDTYKGKFTPSNFGSFTLEAVATDDDGKVTRKEVNFTVKKYSSNASPIISKISPSNGLVIEQDKLMEIELKALITDDSGVVDVLFSIDEEKLAVTKSPLGLYVINWEPKSFKEYRLTIKAEDDEGVISSKTVSFTIKEKVNGNSCNGTPVWESKVYSKSGISVSYNGVIYKNKWYASSSEIPGKSSVWKYVQPCGGTILHCNSPKWLANEIYFAGDEVYFDKKIYKAKWWTKSNPKRSNEWKYVSECTDANESVKINIYPSIVSDEIHLTITPQLDKKVKVEVKDTAGNLCKTLLNLVVKKGRNVFTKNLSSLKQGVYIYSVEIDGNIQTKKIIKK